MEQSIDPLVAHRFKGHFMMVALLIGFALTAIGLVQSSDQSAKERVAKERQQQLEQREKVMPKQCER